MAVTGLAPPAFYVATSMLKSSVVLQAVHGSFQKPGSQDVVFGKETVLELVAVEEEGGVRTVHEQSVFGNIRDMQRLPWNPALRSLPHDAEELTGLDLLAVLSDSGKLSFVAFVSSVHRFVAVAHIPLSLPGLNYGDLGHRLAVHPSGSAVAVAAFENRVAVFPVLPSAQQQIVDKEILYPQHKAALRGDLGPLRPGALAARQAPIPQAARPSAHPYPSPGSPSPASTPREPGAHLQAAPGSPAPALSNCPPFPYTPESPTLGPTPGVPRGQQGASPEWGAIWSMTFVQLPPAATRSLVVPPFGTTTSSSGTAALGKLGVPGGEHVTPAGLAIRETVELAVLVQRRGSPSLEVQVLAFHTSRRSCLLASLALAPEPIPSALIAVPWDTSVSTVLAHQPASAGEGSPGTQRARQQAAPGETPLEGGPFLGAPAASLEGKLARGATSAGATSALGPSPCPILLVARAGDILALRLPCQPGEGLEVAAVLPVPPRHTRQAEQGTQAQGVLGTLQARPEVPTDAGAGIGPAGAARSRGREGVEAYAWQEGGRGSPGAPKGEGKVQGLRGARESLGRYHYPSQDWGEQDRGEQEQGAGMMELDGGERAVHQGDFATQRPAQGPGAEAGAGLGYTGGGDQEDSMEGPEEMANGLRGESSGQQDEERGEGAGGAGGGPVGGAVRGGRVGPRWEEARRGAGSEGVRLMQWLEERCDWLGAGVQVGERLVLSEGKQRRLLHRALEALRYALETGASWDEPQGRPGYAGGGAQSSMELTLEQMLGHNFFCANRIQAARNRAAGVPRAGDAGAEAEEIHMQGHAAGQAEAEGGAGEGEGEDGGGWRRVGRGGEIGGEIGEEGSGSGPWESEDHSSAWPMTGGATGVPLAVSPRQGHSDTDTDTDNGPHTVTQGRALGALDEGQVTDVAGGPALGTGRLQASADAGSAPAHASTGEDGEGGEGGEGAAVPMEAGEDWRDADSRWTAHAFRIEEGASGQAVEEGTEEGVGSAPVGEAYLMGGFDFVREVEEQDEEQEGAGEWEAAALGEERRGTGRGGEGEGEEESDREASERAARAAAWNAVQEVWQREGHLWGEDAGEDEAREGRGARARTEDEMEEGRTLEGGENDREGEGAGVEEGEGDQERERERERSEGEGVRGEEDGAGAEDMPWWASGAARPGLAAGREPAGRRIPRFTPPRHTGAAPRPPPTSSAPAPAPAGAGTGTRGAPQGAPGAHREVAWEQSTKSLTGRNTRIPPPPAPAPWGPLLTAWHWEQPGWHPEEQGVATPSGAGPAFALNVAAEEREDGAGGNTAGTPGDRSGEGSSQAVKALVRLWRRRVVVGTEEGNIHVLTVTQSLAAEPRTLATPSRVAGSPEAGFALASGPGPAADGEAARSPQPLPEPATAATAAVAAEGDTREAAGRLSAVPTEEAAADGSLIPPAESIIPPTKKKSSGPPTPPSPQPSRIHAHAPPSSRSPLAPGPSLGDILPRPRDPRTPGACQQQQGLAHPEPLEALPESTEERGLTLRLSPALAQGLRCTALLWMPGAVVSGEEVPGGGVPGEYRAVSGEGAVLGGGIVLAAAERGPGKIFQVLEGAAHLDSGAVVLDKGRDLSPHEGQRRGVGEAAGEIPQLRAQPQVQPQGQPQPHQGAAGHASMEVESGHTKLLVPEDPVQHQGGNTGLDTLTPSPMAVDPSLHAAFPDAIQGGRQQQQGCTASVNSAREPRAADGAAAEPGGQPRGAEPVRQPGSTQGARAGSARSRARVPSLGLVEKGLVQNMAPLHDFCLADCAGESQDQVVAACGAGGGEGGGSVCLVHNGAGVETLAATPPEYHGVTGVWALRVCEGDAHHSLFVMSFVSQTRVLSVGEAFDDVTDQVGFHQSSTSLCCGRLQDHALVQVCPDKVVLTFPVGAMEAPGTASSGAFVWTPMAHQAATCSSLGESAGDSPGTPGMPGAPAHQGPAGISVAAVGQGVVLLALARPGALVMLACVAGAGLGHALGLQEVRRCALSHELSSISIPAPCLGQPWGPQHRRTRQQPRHHAVSCPMTIGTEDPSLGGTPAVHPPASGALAVLGTYQPGVVVISLDRDPQGGCFPVLASASLEAVQATGGRGGAGAAAEGKAGSIQAGVAVAGGDQPGGRVPESACLVSYDRLYVVCGLRSGALVRFAWPLPGQPLSPSSVPQFPVSPLGSPWLLPPSAAGTALAAQLPGQPGISPAPEKHRMDLDGEEQLSSPQAQGAPKHLDFGAAITPSSSPRQERGEGSGRGHAPREAPPAETVVTAFLCKGGAANATPTAASSALGVSAGGGGVSVPAGGALRSKGSGVRLELAAQRRVGVSPVHLTPLGPCLGSDVLALSDRPWLLRASQGSSRPACLPVSFPAASHGAPLSCPQCPQGLLFISNRSLCIVELEGSKGMKVQRLPLGATPRRVLFHAPSNSILALCTTTMAQHVTSAMGTPTGPTEQHRDTGSGTTRNGDASSARGAVPGPGAGPERGAGAQHAGLGGHGAPLVLPDARALLDSFPAPPPHATGRATGAPTVHGSDVMLGAGNSTVVNSTGGSAGADYDYSVPSHLLLDQASLGVPQAGSGSPHTGGPASVTPRSELCCLDPASGQRRAALLLPPGWQGLSLATWEPREREREREKEREGERGGEGRSPRSSGASGDASRPSAGQASGAPAGREPGGPGEGADQKGGGGERAASGSEEASGGALAAGAPASSTDGAPSANTRDGDAAPGGDSGSGDAQGAQSRTEDGKVAAPGSGETQGQRQAQEASHADTSTATATARQESGRGAVEARTGGKVGAGPRHTGSAVTGGGSKRERERERERQRERERERESGWRLVVVGAVERPLSPSQPMGREDPGVAEHDPLGPPEGSLEAHPGEPQASTGAEGAREDAPGQWGTEQAAYPGGGVYGAPRLHRLRRVRGSSASLGLAGGVPPFSSLRGIDMWQGAAAEWAGAAAGAPSAPLADAGADPDAPARGALFFIRVRTPGSHSSPAKARGNSTSSPMAHQGSARGPLEGAPSSAPRPGPAGQGPEAAAAGVDRGAGVPEAGAGAGCEPMELEGAQGLSAPGLPQGPALQPAAEAAPQSGAAAGAATQGPATPGMGGSRGVEGTPGVPGDHSLAGAPLGGRAAPAPSASPSLAVVRCFHLPGPVVALATYMGSYLLAAAGNLLICFMAHRRPARGGLAGGGPGVKKIAVVRTRHTITALSCDGSRIAVADFRDGILLYTFHEDRRQFELLLCDPAVRLVSSCCVGPSSDSVLAADRQGSLCILGRPQRAADSQNPERNLALQCWFHLGEVGSRVRVGSLALRAPCQERSSAARRERDQSPLGIPPAASLLSAASPQKPGGPEGELPPSLLVSTALGSVVVLLRLSRSEYELLAAVERRVVGHPLTAPLLGNRHDEYRSQGAPASWTGHALGPPHAYPAYNTPAHGGSPSPLVHPEAAWVSQHRALPGALRAGAAGVGAGAPRVLDGDLLAQFRDLNAAVQRLILGPPALWRGAGARGRGEGKREAGGASRGDVLADHVLGNGTEEGMHGGGTVDTGSLDTGSPQRAAGCSVGRGAGVSDTEGVAGTATARSLEAETGAQAPPARCLCPTPPRPGRTGGPEVRQRPSPGLSSRLGGLSPFCERGAASHLALRSAAWASRAACGRAPHGEEGAGHIPLEPVLSLLEQVQDALY